jgi:hypothetical protein
LKPSIGKGKVHKENKRDFLRASKENEIDEMEAFKIASCFLAVPEVSFQRKELLSKKMPDKY